jgi:two-component system, chemotaxis family, protein-glutamate methylesterase/glutaminase
MGTRQLIAIGASLGGVPALESILSRLPATSPPVLVVQHILPAFSGPFSQQLDSVSALRVVEAAHGARLRAGVAYVAPGHRHLLVHETSGELRVVLSQAPPIGFHRPSVDATFCSLAKLTDAAIVAVLLTGMGRDGADGMLALRQVGARTIAQDQASSLIFGMPKAAIKTGGAEFVMSLADIPGAILSCLRAVSAERAPSAPR